MEGGEREQTPVTFEQKLEVLNMVLAQQESKQVGRAGARGHGEEDQQSVRLFGDLAHVHIPMREKREALHATKDILLSKLMNGGEEDYDAKHFYS